MLDSDIYKDQDNSLSDDNDKWYWSSLSSECNIKLKIYAKETRCTLTALLEYLNLLHHETEITCIPGIMPRNNFEFNIYKEFLEKIIEIFKA